MEQLTEFKPLEVVQLPLLGSLPCIGLVLVVGPNSSGKSQLLQDIYLRLCGEPRALVVAKDIRIRKPEYEPFMKWLEAEHYFETVIDDSGTTQWKPLRTYVGTGQPVNQIQPNQAQSWHSSYGPGPEPQVRRRSEFLNYFGRLLVTGLFLERRLTAIQQVGLIDFQTQPPQQDLHALYLDDSARQHLFDEVLESFGKAVWPDCSRGNALCLRVSDQALLPTAEERLSPKKMARYRQVESEGDGLKSYVSTCIALLLGRRPVCLIDEPEMCLHPPQAYNLGRFIGKYGVSQDTVTFVSTHSSQILRGVVQTTRDIQIVRMSRRKGEFSAHLVPANVLNEALTKPTVRAESVLDGIFAESVAVVEADGDRLVYQTVLETLAPELRLDIHLATVGGTGGIADTCKLYRTLRIPVAVIADLDMITDNQRLRRVLEVMTEGNVVADLCQRANKIMEAIKQMPPNIDPASLRGRLRELVEVESGWVGSNDVELRRELNRVSQQLDRLRRLKRGGVDVLPTEIATPLRDLLGHLGRYGVFLVPVGELEESLGDAGIAESKEHKWAWANAAALAIQARGAAKGDIWDFVRTIGRFLWDPELGD